MRNMTVQQLRHFLAVCGEMNYTRAAEKCYISRQALRQSIGALEEELKTSLFFMEANKIKLTETGELLQQRAIPVVKAFSQLEQEMILKTERQIIRLGISFSLIPDYLPTLEENLRTFAERNRGVHIETFNMKNDELADALLGDSIDCALAMDLGCGDERFCRMELSSHPAAIMVSRRNPLSRLPELTTADLAGQKLCIPGTGSFMQPLKDAADKTDNPPELCVVESFYQVYYMVREENRLALNRFIPREGINKYVNNIAVKDLPPLCCALFYPKERDSSTAQRLGRFLQREIRNYFNSISHGGAAEEKRG